MKNEKIKIGNKEEFIKSLYILLIEDNLSPSQKWIIVDILMNNAYKDANLLLEMNNNKGNYEGYTHYIGFNSKKALILNKIITVEVNKKYLKELNTFFKKIIIRLNKFNYSQKKALKKVLIKHKVMKK